MIGHQDMDIVGIQHDGKQVDIMIKGRLQL